MDVNNQYGILEFQKRMAKLLKEFHSFCVKYEVKYTVDWGTMLGAVRHKGFIPWDDDIDVTVDRTNYEKLVSFIDKEKSLWFDDKGPSTYWVGRVHLSEDKDKEEYSLDSNKGEYLPTIDVFIIDNAPDGKLARKLQQLRIMFLQGMLKTRPHYTKGNIIMKTGYFLSFNFGKLFSRERKLRWYSKISQKYNKKHTLMKASYNNEFKELSKLFPSEIFDFDSVITCPFEDFEVFILRDFHKCLVIEYGEDYMTPLPMEERIPFHALLLKRKQAEHNRRNRVK